MMKKKFTLMLALAVFMGTTSMPFADEVKNVEDTSIEQIEEIDKIEPVEDFSNRREMILQLDSTLAWINGEEHTLTARPKVIQGTTYLPLRFMGDMLLEAGVEWDATSRKVTIIKDGTKVEVTIGKNQAYINGDEILIDNPPIIADNITYLPLRTTAGLFDIQTDYDAATRQIKLVKVQGGSYEPPVKKPAIAKFSFAQGEYTAGQIVKAIDSSYHEDGLVITDRLWMINFDESKTNKKLENMFSKPGAGTYLVSLKVEAGKGNWSEWTTNEITIKPNEKPIVTTLLPTKESYAGGEAMDFTYTYDNESWEGIKATRWTYRQMGEDLSKAVVEKPKYIFHQGEYIITLQLQDDYGNWSDAKEAIINISGESRQKELEYRFTKGESGDIIDNFDNFNYSSYREVASDITTFKDGTLYLSDSPENVKSNGILYRDTVSGPGRILIHHHNSFTQEENIAEPKKVVLLAENPTDKPVSFTISNRSAKGPSADILFVGQLVLHDYLKGTPPESYTLKPGEKMLIYDSSSKRWDKGQLISVQMDFNVNGSLKLTTAALAKSANVDDIAYLQDSEKDVHPRGTFNKTDINHKVLVDGSEPTKLVLGAGASEWLTGYDAITGETVQNRGNFAVNYKVEITATEDVGVMLNPRAGLFRGALKWDNEEPFFAPNKGYIMGHNSKGVMLGVVKAGETRTLHYSLPNGSASPVLLVFMPREHWNQ